MYRKFKNRRILCISEKTLVLHIFCRKFENQDEKIFKEGKSIEILINLGSIKNISLIQKYG